MQPTAEQHTYQASRKALPDRRACLHLEGLYLGGCQEVDADAGSVGRRPLGKVEGLP